MIVENLAMIVAIAKNGAIGKKNGLLWHIPEDLKYFKEVTSGHPVIMGWNTWLSLPKKPLPNRTNIIISLENKCIEGCIVFTSINECLEYVKKQNNLCFVIGGESIYKQMIDYTNTLYVTWIDASCSDADAFFPIEKINNFTMISSENHYSETTKLMLKFCVYKR
ncbi:MAG: dihydrofolate reductase [Bacteroidales bacterium]|nr:dihydrofolate reductase [Bacteroidales bacterium]